MNKVIPLLAFSVLLLVPASQDAFALDTTSTIGQFQCWEVQTDRAVIEAAIVDLTDQFGTQNDVFVTSGFPSQPFCASAGVSGFFGGGNPRIDSPFPDLSQQHLYCYPIDGPEVNKEVELTDLWGEVTTNIVGKPVELCVPGTKSLQNLPPNPPTMFDQLTDIHYKCYEITQSDQNFPITVQVGDQFGTTSHVNKLDLANKLCVPVEKTVKTLGGNPIPNPITVGNKDFDDHLKCHQYIQPLSSGIFSAIIQWTDQFLPSHSLGVGVAPNFDPISLCLTASKIIIDNNGDGEVIGGEIIPIEYSSLLLATTQSFSWMIPLLLSGIGIGLFVVSRRSE